MANFYDQLKYSFLYELFTPFFEWVEFFRWKYGSGSVATPHIVKQKIVEGYALKYNLSTFVETGTYLGRMVTVVKNSFDKIFTIEIEKKLFERARNKFRKYSKIKVLKGDSSKVLPILLGKIKLPALFWLDAHFSGGITGKGKTSTPIIKELNQILSHKIKKHVILIDDAHLFNGANGYPSKEEIKKIVSRKIQNYRARVEKNIIVISDSTT